MKLLRCLQCLGGAAVMALSAGASAQGPDYSRGPLRIVVGATPGGTVDTMARLLAEGLSAHLKQPVVVDNKPGAAGAIAADIVAKAKPDGQTLLLGTSGLTTLPLLQKSLPYQLHRDLSLVAITGFTPFLLFAGPNSPATSVQQLVAFAKANPQKLSVASGDGTTMLASELFKAATGISVTSVNYRGGPQMIADIAGGSVDYGFLGATAVLPLAKAGKLRVLGVAGSKRLDIAPEIPTLAEQGVRSFFLEPWTGILVPKGTDRAIVQALEQGLAAAAQSENFQKKVAEIGSFARFLGADAATAFVATEEKTLAQVATTAGIKQAD